MVLVFILWIVRFWFEGVRKGMKLSTRITIIAVVLWVAGAAIFALELLPTLVGIIIISFFRPLVFEKFFDRVKDNER